MAGAPDDGKDSGLKDFAKAESMIQLAIVMPAAILIGMFGGRLLDRWLHTDWIYIAGIIVGAVAGFVQIIRMATHAMKDSK